MEERWVTEDLQKVGGGFTVGNIWTVLIWLTFLEQTTTKLLSTGLWEPLGESKHWKESRHLTKQKKGTALGESLILMAFSLREVPTLPFGSMQTQNNSQLSGLKIRKVRGDITERRGTDSVLSFVYKSHPSLWLTTHLPSPPPPRHMPTSHMHGKTTNNPSKAKRAGKISADAHGRGGKVCSLSSINLQKSSVFFKGTYQNPELLWYNHTQYLEYHPNFLITWRHREMQPIFKSINKD